MDCFECYFQANSHAVEAKRARTGEALVPCPTTSTHAVPGTTRSTLNDANEEDPRPCLTCKRKESSSTDAATSTNEADFDVELEVSKLNEKVSDLFCSDEIKKRTAFEQLSWIQKYLESNPPKKKADVIPLIQYLSNGVDTILEVSKFRFADEEYKLVLRIVKTLFEQFQFFEEKCELEKRPTDAEVYERIETIIDTLLDLVNDETLNAEKHLIRYGLIQGMLMLTDNLTIRKLVVLKLVLRIRSLGKRVQSLFYGVVPGQKVTKGKKKTSKEDEQNAFWNSDPQDLNTFYYYCQILEAAITSVTPNEEGWIERPVYKTMKLIVEECELLFKKFPNMMIILNPAIQAAELYVVKKEELD